MQEQSSPVIRVYTFGKFRVERLERVLAGQPPALQYVPVSNTVWGKRNDGRKLLKLLLCSDYRRAPRDVLLELLWPDAEKRHADRYLNSAASNLRRVLCTPDGETLLRTVRPDRNVTLYELADQHALWLDVDAFLDLVAQAEQAGHDPLPFLEQAQRLACGAFLIEHLYHAWADHLRQSVNAARHRCVYQLATLYEQRHLFEQVEALLYNVLKQDLTDEDVLCRLMQVLARQGKPAEALACYERSKRALDKDLQAQPLASTQALARRLRTETTLVEQAPKKPIAQEHVVVSSALPAVSSFGQPETPLNPAEKVAKYDILIPGSPGTTAISLDTAHGDCAMWFSEQLAQIIAFVSKWQNQMPARDFEKILNRELRVFDEIKAMFNPDTYFLSRRSALLVIAALPKGLLGLLQRQKTAFITEEFLPACSASISACWYLLNGREFASVERALSRYIQYLVGWTQQPSPYQRTAAYLASQGCLLLGFIALHHLQFSQRVVYCQEAVKFGKEAGDATLLVKALTQLGNAYYDQNLHKKMVQSYQEAKSLMQDVPYSLQSKVLMGLAHAHAQQGQAKEALDAISHARMIFPGQIEDVPAFLSADDGVYSLILFEGWVHLDLGKQYPDRSYNRQAAQALAQIESVSTMTLVPERYQHEIVNRRAQASIVLGDLDAFREYTLQSAGSLKHIHSDKRRQELVTNYKAAREKWPHESHVLELADMLL